MSNHYVVMGVCGCGKSTVGSLLAEQLGIPFFDGDAFHPQNNIDKMASGVPLDDNDRKPWLEQLAQLLTEQQEGCVIACSALKKSYRETLASMTPVNVIHLHGDREILLQRLNQRAIETDHFMPASLLDSQLATLEDPKSEPNCRIFNIINSPSNIVSSILNQ